jgi:hypothetical protein
MSQIKDITLDSSVTGTEFLLGTESDGTTKRISLASLQTYIAGITQAGTTFTGTLLPNADNTLDLGSADASWRNLFIDGTATLATVDINAGAIDGTTIGASSESTGKFTTLQLTGSTNILSDLLPTDGTFDLGSSTKEFQDLYIDGTAYLDAVDIDSGAIDGTAIGANSHSTGKFTTLQATGTFLDGDGGAGASGQVLSSTGSTTNWITVSTLTNLVENNSVFIGFNPSSTTNSASFNVSVGTTALDAITTGDNNVAIGYNSLTAATTTSSNVAIGKSAMSSVTTGSSQSVAIGFEALNSLETGLYNTAIGYRALETCDDGNNNVAVGYQALETSTTPTNSTAIGYKAGNAAEGTSNTLIGYEAGKLVASGTHNVTLGTSAGDVITTGAQNICIGSGTDPSANNTNNEIVIGYGITGEGQNKTVIGNTSTTGARIYGLRSKIVNITGNTSLTANDSGETFVFNDADGAVITLPDSGTGTLLGVYYTFIIGVTATSNAHKVVFTDTTNEKLYGQIHSVDTDSSDAFDTFAAQEGDGFSAISSNGTTTGIIGTKYTITNFAADKWYVEGHIHCTGNPATPFATS